MPTGFGFEGLVQGPTYSSKTAMVTATLREMILTGAIEGGTHLRQRELAAQFDVSATPVREALARLEAQGLVSTDAHKGATVITGHFGDSDENYQIRGALEGLGARLATANVTDAELKEIEAIHERFASLDPEDPNRADLNREFHFKIYEASRSPLLLALLRLLWQAFPKGPVLHQHDRGVAEHAELLEALEARDADEAERVLHDHIGSARAFRSKDGP